MNKLGKMQYLTSWIYLDLVYPLKAPAKTQTQGQQSSMKYRSLIYYRLSLSTYNILFVIHSIAKTQLEVQVALVPFTN